MIKIEELPEGWKIKKIGEVCEKITNGSSAKQFEEKVGYPISRIETIWNSTIDYKRVRYVLEKDEDFLKKYALKNNDILFSHINSDSHLGKTAIYKSKSTEHLIHGINLLLIRANDLINPDFFNYQFKYLRSQGKFISIAQKSVNQSSINQAKLKNVDIVVPPLEVQKQIVSKLEELLSELEKGKEQLETAQQQLKVYRQAVLKRAFEGKLTNKDIKEGELPEGWHYLSLEDLLEFIGSGVTPKGGQNVYQNSGVIFLRSQNVYPNKLELEDVAYISFQIDEKMKRSRVRPEDVLLNITGASIGRCTYVPNTFPNANVNQHVCILRPRQEIISSQYLSFYLNSPNGQGQIFNKYSGATRQGLNYQQIRTFAIPIPPLNEQTLIIQEIESKLSVCDKIEETIIQNLQQVETLRQSILKRAFEGKLILE